MPLRYLRDAIFNDATCPVRHFQSMEQQIQSLGMITPLESRAGSPWGYFFRALFCQALLTSCVTLLVLWIVDPLLARCLDALPDAACIMRKMKEMVLLSKR